MTEAPDGAKALRWFAGQPTDVVISDIYMPEMNGIEFLMRVQEAFPEARVIAMSGGGFISKDDVLEAASKLGANGVLPKPFGPDEVLDQVARVLAAKNDQIEILDRHAPRASMHGTLLDQDHVHN